MEDDVYLPVRDCGNLIKMGSLETDWTAKRIPVKRRSGVRCNGHFGTTVTRINQKPGRTANDESLLEITKRSIIVKDESFTSAYLFMDHCKVP